MQSNTNFDSKAPVFARNIYGTTKGHIRLAVLQRDLDALLANIQAASLPQGQKLRIVDAGGGFGPLSQGLAALGHTVVLCDLSADMLALAKEQVSEKGILSQFEFQIAFLILSSFLTPPIPKKSSIILLI